MKNVTLVLGASLKEDRYSNKAIRKLKECAKDVVALGLRAGVVDGVLIEIEKIFFKNIDTTCCAFRLN